MAAPMSGETHDGRARFDQLTGPPVFVIGASRSGTTWVYDILTSHPLVAGVRESWLFTDNAGIKKLFGDAHRPGRKSGLGNLLSPEELLAHSRAFAISLFSHAIGPQHRFFVEKSPSHAYSIELIEQFFPSARFIHVLRDGRDVSVSVRAAARSWEPSWRKLHGKSIFHSARAWQHLVATVAREKKALGDRLLEVRYESLRTRPFEQYPRLFDFCGIPCDAAQLEKIHQQNDFESQYEPNESGFRRGGRVGDWKSHFSLLDALAYQLGAGATLVEQGYAEKGWWLPGRRRAS